MMLDTEVSRQLCFDIDNLGYVVGVVYSMSVAEQKLVTEHHFAFTKEISSDVSMRNTGAEIQGAAIQGAEIQTHKQ